MQKNISNLCKVTQEGKKKLLFHFFEFFYFFWDLHIFEAAFRRFLGGGLESRNREAKFAAYAIDS